MPFMPEESSDLTPVIVAGASRPARWLVLCDHASNAVPSWVANGDLGISRGDMSRHIAYDVGASGLALKLAERLDAPAVLANYSRLVIDPNRGEHDPTLVMRIYDGTIIPANRDADETEIERRKEMLYRPYHRTIAEIAARRSDTVILSVHSFTPQFRGRKPRPWHVTLLFADDDRLSLPLLAGLARERQLVVGANQPYSGRLEGDTIDRHAVQTRRQNALIEVRNDLIGEEKDQAEWADRLARVLPEALQAAETRGEA